MRPCVGALVIIKPHGLRFGAGEHWATATPPMCVKPIDQYYNANSRSIPKGMY